MTAVKDNVLDLEKGLQLIKSYQEQKEKQAAAKRMFNPIPPVKVDMYPQ